MRSILILCSAALLCLLGAWSSGLRLNTTGSMPVGVYRLSEDGPKKGDYVVFCPDSALAEFGRDFLGAGICPAGCRPLLKLIVAGPGDTVSLTASGVAVNGVDLPNSRVLEQDRSGRTLPHSLKPGAVPSGAALLMAPHPSSFDGRYFGFVASTALQKVIPVFIF